MSYLYSDSDDEIDWDSCLNRDLERYELEQEERIRKEDEEEKQAQEQYLREKREWVSRHSMPKYCAAAIVIQNGWRDFRDQQESLAMYQHELDSEIHPGFWK